MLPAFAAGSAAAVPPANTAPLEGEPRVAPDRGAAPHAPPAPDTPGKTKGGEAGSEPPPSDGTTPAGELLLPAQPEAPERAGAEPAAKASSGKPAPAKPCDLVPCRAPGKVFITTVSGSVVELDQPGYPFVSPAGAVTVLPGETVHVEFHEAEGRLTNAAYAAEMRASERTVSFELARSEGAPMLLMVSNPFGRPLKYDAAIETVGRAGKPGKLRRTSSCAVAARSKAFEMWPDQISRFQAENFRLLGEGDTSCK